MNTMKEKLFKWLFPEKTKEIEVLKQKVYIGQKDREYWKELYEEKPTMADLMRDSLGLPMIDFINVDKDGEPPHYLHGLDEDKRAIFIGELSNIYRKPEFKAVINYWTNLFGNYAVRNADKDPQPGRYGINGVACIRKSFESAHKEFVAMNSPEEGKEEDE